MLRRIVQHRRGITLAPLGMTMPMVAMIAAGLGLAVAALVAPAALSVGHLGLASLLVMSGVVGLVGLWRATPRSRRKRTTRPSLV